MNWINDPYLSWDDWFEMLWDTQLPAFLYYLRRRYFTWRFITKRCMDCGIRLKGSYDHGDVCEKCFDEFNGLTIEEIIGE